MSKTLFIKRFEIKELFGIYNVDIPFKNNINIFVGENGLGKTTILNVLNYIIQGDSESLSSINFNTIILTLGNNTKIKILHDDLLNNNLSLPDRNRVNHYLEEDDYSFITRRIAMEIFKEKSPKILEDKEEREKIFERILRRYRYDLSPSMLEKIYNLVLKNENFQEDLKNSWEYKIYQYMKNWDKCSSLNV